LNSNTISILKDLNDGLEKLSHMVWLSKVHWTTKGNLIITAAPDVSAEQLALVTTALTTIVLGASRIGLSGC
jgi:hypothetical protein